jgi:hypothetical protein
MISSSWLALLPPWRLAGFFSLLPDLLHLEYLPLICFLAPLSDQGNDCVYVGLNGGVVDHLVVSWFIGELLL